MYQGVVNSGTLNAAQKMPSFADVLTKKRPNGVSPIYYLLSKMGKKKALQIKHGYWSENLPLISVTNTVAQVAGDTNITIANNTDVIAGDVFRIPATGELVRITSTTGNPVTSVVIQRSIGDIVAGAIAINSVWEYVGTSFEEGSSRPTPRRIQQVYVDNATQIFRNSWAVNGTAAAEHYYAQAGGNPVGKDKLDGALMHAADIERALLWGQMEIGSLNGQPFHTMDGIETNIRKYAPAANITIAGATTNYDQLETALDPCFDTITEGSTNERWLVTGSKGYKIFNAIGRKTGQYQLEQGQTEYGLRFQSFIISRGTFHIIEHPLLSQVPAWSNKAFALDLSSMSLAYLGDRDAQHKAFGDVGDHHTDNSVDQIGGTYLSELTLEFRNPSACAIIHNLTAAA